MVCYEYGLELDGLEAQLSLELCPCIGHNDTLRLPSLPYDRQECVDTQNPSHAKRIFKNTFRDCGSASDPQKSEE
jgi:hypothetical protein